MMAATMPGTPCPHPSSRTSAPWSLGPSGAFARLKRCLARSSEHSQSLKPPSYFPRTRSLRAMSPSAPPRAFAASVDVTAPLTTVTRSSSLTSSGLHPGTGSGTSDASTSVPAMRPCAASSSSFSSFRPAAGSSAAAASASPPKLKRNPPLSPSSAPPHIARLGRG